MESQPTHVCPEIRKSAPSAENYRRAVEQVLSEGFGIEALGSVLGMIGWTRSYRLLAALIVIEAIVLYSQFGRQIAPYYPRGFDQDAIISQAYSTYLNVVSHGLFELWQALKRPGPTTATYPVIGSLFMLVSGPTRTSFFTINVTLFFALQFVMFRTVRRWTESIALAWLSVAALLSLPTVFSETGGIFDLRMDFAALCLFGIVCCLVIDTNGFERRQGLIPLFIVTAGMIATRYITIAYVGAVLFVYFIFTTTCFLILERKATIRGVWFSRSKNVFFFGLTTAITVAVLLYLVRAQIYQYYVVGHVLNAEQYVRALEYDPAGLGKLYYFHSIFTDHFGLTSALILGGGVAGFLVGTRAYAGRPNWDAARLVFLLITFLAPIGVLSMDRSKSPVVGSVVSIPIILVVVSICRCLLPGRAQVHRIFAAAGMFVGGFSFLANANHRQHFLSLEDLKSVDRINLAIAEYALHAPPMNRTISYDFVSEAFNALNVAIVAAEKLNMPVQLQAKLGAGIFAPEREAALSLWSSSQILVLSDPVLGRGTTWPIDAKVKEYWTELEDIAVKRYREIASEVVANVPIRVFAGPLAVIPETPSDWITSAGLQMTVDRRDLERWPIIRIAGRYQKQWIGPDLGVTAEASTDRANETVPIPVSVKIANNQYEITIDATSMQSGTSRLQKIALKFDHFFVPKKLGINGDTSELVIEKPTSITFSSAP